MVAAGMAVVDSHGAAHAPRMLPLFEGFLDRQRQAQPKGQAHPPKGGKGGGMMSHDDAEAEEEERYDLIRSGVVVFLGTLAKHLPPGDPKRLNIIETLLQV